MDVLCTLDHYPIRKRDIDENVIHYIEECSRDIPLNKSIKMEIKIKGQARDAELEDRTRKGMNNYFSYIQYVYKKKSKSTMNTSFLYLLVFVVLTMLTLSVEALNIKINIILSKTILEGLSIGSWVFLWESIAGILIKNKENRYMVNIYKRLATCQLFFVY